MSVQAELELIRNIADELPVGVWVARAPGGELLYANKTFAEILGIAGRDDVGRGEYAQPYGIHGRDGALYPEDKMPFVRALEARAPVIVDDIVIHRADGRKVYIRAVAKPHLEHEGGEPTMVSIAFIDITPEVRAQQEREESEAQMRRAQRLESIGNLAGGVAHDFNNLLSVVRTLAEMVEHEEDPERRREDLRSIRDVTESAVQLTRSLLGFAGRGKHHVRPIRLSDVVRGIAPMLERTLDPRIEVVMTLSSTRRVLGDLSMLEQVVMNLVVNARDAMPEGGRLEVRTYDEGQRSVLEVSDTGSGIDPAIRDRVFEPYFTTKAEGAYRGTGLGLATVYGIVIESHGGTLEIRDPLAGGTLMRVTLPSEPAPVTEAAPKVSLPAPSGVVRGSGLVLVVDDMEVVRLTFGRALKSLGYRVVEAADGRSAVEIFAQRHREIVVVLLDMRMPRLDGRGAFLEMQRIDPDVRVLLTTGYTVNPETQSMLDLGVRAFVPKPAGLEELSRAIAEVARAGRPDPGDLGSSTATLS